MKSCLNLIIVCILCAVNFVNADSNARIDGSFANGGVYGSGSFGKLAHVRTDLSSDLTALLTQYKEDGKYVVIQLAGYPKLGEDYVELEAWLQRNDLSLIDVILFGEEQPYDGALYLDPLFDKVKEFGDVPVYSWYSMPLGPSGKSDGFWYDYYGHEYSTFREKARQYLVSGKPLGMTLDGSGYSKLSSARDQFMICKEFDLPISYFIADSGSGSINNWYSASRLTYVPYRNFVFSGLEFQKRSVEPWSLEAGDLIWGDPIEVSGDLTGSVSMSLDHADHATIYGFTHLEIEDGLIHSTGDIPVSLDYQFWSLFSLENAKLTVVANGSPYSLLVEQSRAGRENDWTALTGYMNEDGSLAYEPIDVNQEFRIRLTLLDNQISIQAPMLSGNLSVNPGDGVALFPMFYNGWRQGIRFAQDFGNGQWRSFALVEGVDELEPGQRLAMSGKSGAAVEATVVERFTSSRALRDIQIRLGINVRVGHAASVRLGVSLDGKNLLYESEYLTETQTFLADLSEIGQLNDINNFYVHVILRNNSGAGNVVSTRIQELEIDANLM